MLLDAKTEFSDDVTLQVWFCQCYRDGLRGYVIGRAEHGRSMDMGGAMHAPRCMLRASILSVGGCRDAEHARRARSKSPTVTETRMGRLKYEEQIQEDHGKQRDGFRTQ